MKITLGQLLIPGLHAGWCRQSRWTRWTRSWWTRRSRWTRQVPCWSNRWPWARCSRYSKSLATFQPQKSVFLTSIFFGVSCVIGKLRLRRPCHARRRRWRWCVGRLGIGSTRVVRVAVGGCVHGGLGGLGKGGIVVLECQKNSIAFQNRNDFSSYTCSHTAYSFSGSWNTLEGAGSLPNLQAFRIHQLQTTTVIRRCFCVYNSMASLEQ